MASPAVQSTPAPLVVVYIGGRRDRAAESLNTLRGLGELTLAIPRLATIPSLVRHRVSGRRIVVLVESGGVYAAAALMLGRLLRARVALRIKGFVYTELGFSIAGPGRSASSRVKAHINRSLTRHALPRADQLVPISERVARHLRKHGHANVTGTVSIAPRLRKSPGDTNVPVKRPYVITMTNFNFAQKVRRLPEFAEDLMQILDELGFDWLIVGDGLHREAISNEMATFGSPTFMGHVQDPQQLVSGARSHIYISNLDTVSASLVESFALGIPCLINDDFPVDEIANNVLPIQILAAKQADLRRTLLDVCSDNQVRSDIIARQLEIVDDYFAPERITQQLRDLLFPAVDA